MAGHGDFNVRRAPVFSSVLIKSVFPIWRRRNIQFYDEINSVSDTYVAKINSNCIVYLVSVQIKVLRHNAIRFVKLALLTSKAAIKLTEDGKEPHNVIPKTCK